MHCSEKPSFDHLVGAGEERRRNVEPERLSGLEIECAAERHEKKEGNNMK
jgi:hypothetical protein